MGEHIGGDRGCPDAKWNDLQRGGRVGYGLEGLRVSRRESGRQGDEGKQLQRDQGVSGEAVEDACEPQRHRHGGLRRRSCGRLRLRLEAQDTRRRKKKKKTKKTQMHASLRV